MKINKFWVIGLLLLIMLPIAWHRWHDYAIVVETMGMRLETTVFDAGVALLVALLLLFVLYQGTIGVLTWPRQLFCRLFKQWRPDCVHQIEELLIAVSNHDSKKAHSIFSRLDRDKVPMRLLLILANEVAMLDADVAQIKQSFIDLAGCPETRTAGLEGLLNMALQEHDWEAANSCCEQLWRSAPSEWLAATHVFVLLYNEAWEQLCQLLHTGNLRHYCTHEVINQLCLIAHHYTAVRHYQEHKEEEAIERLELGAQKCGLTFMPLNLLLGELYLKHGKIKQLERMLCAAWEIHPHPGLAELAMGMAEHYNPARFFTTILKMVSAQTTHYESLLLVARAGLLCGNHEEVLAALNAAIAQQEGIRGCTLMAEYHQATGANIPETMSWLRRASDAKDDRYTICYYWDESTQRLVNHSTPSGFLIACV